VVQISNSVRRLVVASLTWLTLSFAALGAQLAPFGLQQVTLGWNASPDPTVVGYYLYYGVASGVYTSKIDVSTNTTFTASGLVAGSTYYFTTTSYTAARVESSYVAEVAFIVPGILAVTKSDGATTRIQFPVAPAHSYQLQASPDLKTWSNLWLTPIQTTNGWIEYDEPFSDTLSAKFYRLILN
jgi:hypothetical protein